MLLDMSTFSRYEVGIILGFIHIPVNYRWNRMNELDPGISFVFGARVSSADGSHADSKTRTDMIAVEENIISFG